MAKLAEGKILFWLSSLEQPIMVGRQGVSRSVIAPTVEKHIMSVCVHTHKCTHALLHRLLSLYFKILIYCQGCSMEHVDTTTCLWRAGVKGLLPAFGFEGQNSYISSRLAASPFIC